MTHYITNKDCYYFAVKQDIDLAKLQDCKVHKSALEMCEYVLTQISAESDGPESLLDDMIVIENNTVTQYWTIEDIDTNIEDFINNFEM